MTRKNQLTAGQRNPSKARMGRPHKCRFINCDPEVTYFKPRGISLEGLAEKILYLDELEALRLSDLNGLNQTAAAKKMDISQPTFHRIVTAARKKIADALVNGKALKIDKHVVKIGEQVKEK